MLVDIGDGVWVDPPTVDAIAEERGPGGVTSVAIFIGGEKISVMTPIAEVAKRVNDGLSSTKD